MPEQYIPLALDERPKTFDMLKGQEPVIHMHKVMIRKQRIPSAVMYIGGAGSGKTSTARITAKAVNCEDHQDGNPCLTCPTCQMIELGTEDSILEIDAASNRGIDSIKSITDWCGYESNLRYRVVILDEVHMLTKEAANALLKTLEESSKLKVLFVLATTDPQEVPETIRSRCQIFNFRRLSKPNVLEYLSEICARRKIQCDPIIFDLIYEKREGAVRDTVSDLDQLVSYADDQPIEEQMFYDVFSAIRRTFYEDLLLILANSQVSQAFEHIDTYKTGIASLMEFIKGLLKVLADIYRFHVVGSVDDLSQESRDKVKSIAECFTAGQIRNMIETIEDRYVNSNCGSTYLVLRLLIVPLVSKGQVPTNEGHPMDNKLILDSDMNSILKYFPGAKIVSITRSSSTSH